MKKYNTYIIVTTRFSATHCWPDCPFEEMDFLKNKHRHEFHVKVKMKVSHSDRDKEFLIFKREINDCISSRFANRHLSSMSCETMAQIIGRAFEDIISVEVWEDGENGAGIEYIEE